MVRKRKENEKRWENENLTDFTVEGIFDLFLTKNLKSKT